MQEPKGLMTVASASGEHKTAIAIAAVDKTVFANG